MVGTLLDARGLDPHRFTRDKHYQLEFDPIPGCNVVRVVKDNKGERCCICLERFKLET